MCSSASPQAAAAALALMAARKAVSAQSLARVLDSDEDLCRQALLELETLRLCRRMEADGVELWLSVHLSRKSTDLLADIVASTRGTNKQAAYLCILHSDSTLEDCQNLIFFIKDKLLDGLQEVTQIYQELVVDFLHKFSASHKNISPYDGLVFVRLVLLSHIVNIYSQPLLHKSSALLPIAYEMAQKFGNKNFNIILAIVKELSHHFLGNRSFASRNFLEKELINAKNTTECSDDPDMQNLLYISEGFWAFVCGDFQKVLDSYNRAYNLDSPLGKYFFEMLTAGMFFASGYLRQYHLAFAHFDNVCKSRSDVNSRVLISAHTVNFSFLLLRKGDRERAIEYIHSLFEAGMHTNNYVLQTLSGRALALYHYLEGRLGHAYRVLESETLALLGKGIRPLSFLDPLILDMLYEFEQEGLPSVPTYELSGVIRTILKGPNAHMRGAALRIHALQRRKAGAKPQSVVALLKASLRTLIPTGDPREVALSAYLLGRACHAAGQEERAQGILNLLRGTCDQRLRSDMTYRQAGIACLTASRELPLLFARYDSQGKVSRKALVPRGLCARCHKIFHDRSLRAPLSEQFLFLVKTAQIVLKAERAFLCTADEQGGISCEAAIPPQSGDVSDASGLLRKTLAKAGALSQCAYLRSKNGLCLTLDVGSERPWFLCVENHFTPPDFVHLPAIELDGLARAFAAELRFCLRFEAYREEKKALGVSSFQDITAQTAKSQCLVMGDGLRDLLKELELVGSTDAPILLLGETGVGKEVVARRVHQISRRKGPFIAVHPASMTETLFASEFFGHEKGAFTGAIKQKMGLFELADQGTLFIDEIGEMPLSIQANFLRVLQEQYFMRVGGMREIKSDFRLLTATNRDLEQEVRDGNFRRDLLYRIAVVPIRIPSLRERRMDILPLVEAFVGHFSRRYNKALPVLAPELLEQMRKYDWPGNVRELKNAIERIIILGGKFPTLAAVSEGEDRADVAPLSGELFNGFPTLDEMEQRYLRHVLQRTEGRVRGEGGAAALLRMNPPTLYAKLRKYGLPYGLRS